MIPKCKRAGRDAQREFGLVAASRTGIVRQLRRRLADVQLPGHHIGDETRAILAEEVGLAAGL